MKALKREGLLLVSGLVANIGCSIWLALGVGSPSAETSRDGGRMPVRGAEERGPGDKGELGPEDLGGFQEREEASIYAALDVPITSIEGLAAFFELSGRIKPETQEIFGLTNAEAAGLNEVVEGAIGRLKDSERRGVYERETSWFPHSETVIPPQPEMLRVAAREIGGYLAGVLPAEEAELLTKLTMLSRPLNDARYERRLAIVPHKGRALVQFYLRVASDGGYRNAEEMRGYNRWGYKPKMFGATVEDERKWDAVRYKGIFEYPEEGRE